MKNETGFQFVSMLEGASLGDGFVGMLPSGIQNTNQLLDEISRVLSFPAYFGGNWNAFYDCLRDFHWVEMREVFLVHHDLPNLLQVELKIYLEVLRDVANDWSDDDTHKLFILFDKQLQQRVLELINCPVHTVPTKNR